MDLIRLLRTFKTRYDYKTRHHCEYLTFKAG